MLALFSGFALGIDKCDPECKLCHLFDHEITECDGVVACKGGWHCLSCNEGLTLWFDRCLPPCPVGTYRFGYECEPCPAHCSQCTGSLDHECIRCHDTHELDYRRLCVKKCMSNSYPDFVPHTGSLRCLPCNDACMTCIGTWTHSCTSCMAGNMHRILHKETNSGECFPYCDLGYFRDMTFDHRCIACGTNCLQCVNADKCLRCEDRYFLYPAEKRVPGFDEYLNRECLGRDELGKFGFEEVPTLDDCGEICDKNEACRALEWTEGINKPCALSTTCELVLSKISDTTNLYLRGGPKTFPFSYCYTMDIPVVESISISKYLGISDEKLAEQQGVSR